MADPPRSGRPGALGPGLLVVGALLVGCTAGAPPADADRAVEAAPPAPPAACLLDTAALAATTGLTWSPDRTTASDTRCVYDPDESAGAGGTNFVAVDIAPAAELDTLAQLCEDGSRAAVAAADGGFVCRFQGGSVFAAVVRGEQVITLAASAVPPGTTAARLVLAFTEQLGEFT